MLTVCLTYFRSLTLANLEAALYSLRQQDLSRVERIVIVDNNTDDSLADIYRTVSAANFSDRLPHYIYSDKHGDPTRTHSWSTNLAVSKAATQWVLFCRADYILDFDLIRRFVEVADSKAYDWAGFVTANVYHLNADIVACDRLAWRTHGTSVLRASAGAEADYTVIDAGVWLSRRDAFHAVGGLDESLSAWGHAQTHFQHKLFQAGVEFVRIPEVLFYHPQHAARRDIDVAHQQLRGQGVDIHKMWDRYHGVSPYKETV